MDFGSNGTVILDRHWGNRRLAGQLLNVPNAVNGFNLTSIVVAFAGAVIVIVVVRMSRDGSRRSYQR